jgi:hypothetical protein
MGHHSPVGDDAGGPLPGLLLLTLEVGRAMISGQETGRKLKDLLDHLEPAFEDRRPCDRTAGSWCPEGPERRLGRSFVQTAPPDTRRAGSPAEPPRTNQLVGAQLSRVISLAGQARLEP